MRFKRWFAWYPICVAKPVKAEWRWLCFVERKLLLAAIFSCNVYLYRDIGDQGFGQ